MRWKLLVCFPWLLYPFLLLRPLLLLYLWFYDRERARFYRINDLAARAYRKEKWPEAEQRAREGLALADRFPKDWNYSNVIHDCHQILGLLRLREDDRAAARQHLLDAGNTRGSPQLDSYGPSLVLARELLKHDERQVVLEYLDLIACFWAPSVCSHHQRDPLYLQYADNHRPTTLQQRKHVSRRFQGCPWCEEARGNIRLIKRWKKVIQVGRVPKHDMWSSPGWPLENRPRKAILLNRQKSGADPDMVASEGEMQR